MQQASAEVSKVKIYLYICHLYVHTCEAKLHCILAVIAFLQLMFATELNVVWRNESPSLWFSTTRRGWGPPSSETSHRYSSATYLINLPKQAYAFFTSNCVHICLILHQTECHDTTVMKLMLRNWATQPAGFEEHPWAFLRTRRCIEKNKKETPDTLIVQGHQSCLKFLHERKNSGDKKHVHYS